MKSGWDEDESPMSGDMDFADLEIQFDDGGKLKKNKK